MAAYSIREAQEKDYFAIWDILCKVLGYTELTQKQTIGQLNRIQAHSDYQTYVAEADGKVIGFIGLFRGLAYEDDGEYLKIMALAIYDEYQGRGIGKALLQTAEAYAKEHKMDCIGLNSGLARQQAHQFYEKNGFVKKSYGFSKVLE
ncbi:GNAT family N-acetyltransferase [Paludicola sp. MB14-C6]|uniref:GNAT family N-acetyltransferase n=1 Tax=Paludihabitans sp. MB14-C6 TaxID=3070656 RepID=UPI0027DB8D61|nr:GNAT family N-acetyltransferase [Paludicola sp. MB14-C6]WMJ22772.1 GNAT family N-acetyltransferase [Paludicola sp. MB14-C6]